MDQTTQDVRAMYEQFPYPSGAPELRVSSDARLVLSRARRCRPKGGPITVLDAGCGRGVGVMGAAAMQPDVSFLGIDINRVALEEARREAAARGLDNLRFAEVDLMSLDGLEVPEGGFDVIFSSGVVHHLSDPRAGLERLREVLAPHGVVVLMVYARLGRAGLYRVAAAIDACIPRSAALSERLEVGREVVAQLAAATGQEPWRGAAAADDIEFVDRYLNVNEVSYDVAGLFELFQGAGLHFLEWCQPTDWAVEIRVPDGPLRELAVALSPRDQARLVAQIAAPSKFEVLLCGPDNGPREALRPADLAETPLAVSPEGVFELRTRSLFGSVRRERLVFRRADGVELALANGPIAVAGLILRDQFEPFSGADLFAAMADQGVSTADAHAVCLEYLRLGVLYRPHAIDL